MKSKKSKQQKKERRDNETAAAEAAAEAARTDDDAAEAAESGGEQAGAGADAVLEQLRAQIDDLNNKILRSKADLENYRKRAQREFAEIRTSTRANTVAEFLTVYDHFQMAMQHAEEQADFNTLKQGMDMILAEMRKTLENLGVSEVEAVGKPFNPHEHEAMAQEPSEEIPEGHVLRQWKSGFRMGERLLRPATVVVSSGEQKDEAAEKTEQSENKG